MSLCVLAGGKALTFAVTLFSLQWTHSVQKTEWQENWQVTPAGLVLQTARIKGSGAGMEPGPDAVLKDGWWEWSPELPPLERVVLAASGATASAWTLCHTKGCLELGAQAGEDIVISACGEERPEAQ